MMTYPPHVYGVAIPNMVIKEHPEFEKLGAIYLDMWPITSPMIYVQDPRLMDQFTNVFHKADMMHDEFRPWTGNRDIVTSEGPQWKRWRSLFNPGFSAKNIISLVPAFLEESQVFIQGLKKAAETGEVMTLEDGALNLALDIIGRAAL